MYNNHCCKGETIWRKSISELHSLTPGFSLGIIKVSLSLGFSPLIELLFQTTMNNTICFNFLSLDERKLQRKSSQNEFLPALLQCKNFKWWYHINGQSYAQTYLLAIAIVIYLCQFPVSVYAKSRYAAVSGPSLKFYALHHSQPARASRFGWPAHSHVSKNHFGNEIIICILIP